MPIQKREVDPLPAHPRRDLIFVSAGLGLDGGGRAVAGRLLAAACAELRAGAGPRAPPADARGRRPAGGRRRRCGLRRRRSGRWRSTSGGGSSGGGGTAYVFDLLGPARVQAYLPGPLRAPYLVPLYGIEVWRPLEWDRRRALARATARFAISAHTLERARPFCPDLAGTAVRPPGAGGAAAGGGGGRRADRPARPRLPADRGADGRERALQGARRSSWRRCPGCLAPPGARLVVAGDGDDRPRLEEKAAYLELEGAVSSSPASPARRRSPSSTGAAPRS